MRIELQIPESVRQAIRLPKNWIRQESLTELAVALYLFSFPREAWERDEIIFFAPG